MASKHYGKARRLVAALEAVAGGEVAGCITRGLQEPSISDAPRRKADWTAEVISRMDAELTPEQCRQVMARRACRMSANAVTADRALWARSEDLGDFARRKRELGWGGFQAEGNVIRACVAAGKCHCLPAYGIKVPISPTYCLCCAGHMQQYLQDLFGVPVDTEVESSVVRGASECWIAAHVGGRGAAAPVPPGITQATAGARDPFARPDRPIPAEIVPLPGDLPLAPDELAALRLVHDLLQAIATAAHAETNAERDAMARARQGMWAVLWCMGQSGDLLDESPPCLYMEKTDAKGRGIHMPDESWALELQRFRMPGVSVRTLCKKPTSPKNWEIRLFLGGPEQGAVALRMLQRYVRALSAAYGQARFQGSRRYEGAAYERFVRADMGVLGDR